MHNIRRIASIVGSINPEQRLRRGIRKKNITKNREENVMWSKTKKAMNERRAPSLKGWVLYDFEYCRPHYRTEIPANPNCHCMFCSYNRFFRTIIDKKENIMIANSDVYYKSKFCLQKDSPVQYRIR